MYVLWLQLLPPPSPLAPIKSRMETFWYWLTKVYLEMAVKTEMTTVTFLLLFVLVVVFLLVVERSD